MLKNINYDMVQEIAELSKSIARMDTYAKDAKDCNECKHLWQELKKRQEEELQMVYREFEKRYTQKLLMENMKAYPIESR